MTFNARRILRFELTVSDLDRAEKFYVMGLGFNVVDRNAVDTALTLRRGGQILVLQTFHPPGAPYPPNATSSDQVFQHFAIPVRDMIASHARLQTAGPIPISKEPQHLPARSGGVTAFKFRDPDGHPLELIQFPDDHDDGIDHSGIVVMNAKRSIAWYRDTFGFRVASRQTNTGPEQDRLDGLTNVTVDVVALQPENPSPHLELLAYHNPPVRSANPLRPRDIAATRLVIEVDRLPDGARAISLQDPDHHTLILVAPDETQA